VVGFLVIGGLLVYQATQGTSSLIFSPKELVEKGNNISLQRIRVAGKVSDPIEYKTEPNIELTFLVSDPTTATSSLPVIYRNLKPDMFAAGRDVLIDGDFDNGRIVAAKLLTQCPSKYEPPSPGAAYSHPAEIEKK
jgi:cytochrome c-type biogenesis protein CcmE